MKLDKFLGKHGLTADYQAHAQKWFNPVLEDMVLHKNNAKPTFIGINGCQGSGKSTLADYAITYLQKQHALSVVAISIDDFYYGKHARQVLATEVHPLLAVRGVPGTHDIQQALQVFAALLTRQPCRIPRFDKAEDDTMPEAQWTSIDQPVDVIILEGWCVGLTPQDNNLLSEACNHLERFEDPQRIWRKYANQALDTYQSLFSYLDALWMLKAPSFKCVYQWRLEQEQKLAQHSSGSAIQDEQQIARFIQFYERLTNHGLHTLPYQADVVWHLDQQRRITNCQRHQFL
jgi:D-glycerate 3-kinase